MKNVIRPLGFVLFGVLTACDSPSVAFLGSQKTIVVIESSTFSVHRREDRVEVYRTSFELLPDRAQVLRHAELAIMQATGCKVWKGSLNGDQALIKARLACGGREVPPASIPDNLYYQCEIIDGWDFDNRELSTEALACELVRN